MHIAPMNTVRQTRRFPDMRRIWKYRALYLILLPSLIYFFVFHYYPYYGLTIAFKDFSPGKGIWHSPWVGFEHFRELMNLTQFRQVFVNTMLISSYNLVFGFPFPILLALMLNEVRFMVFKRLVQTVTYFPHFLSWVIFGGIALSFLQPNGVIPRLFAEWDIDLSSLLTSTDHFRAILVATHIIKEFGWTAIIYLAALTGINPDLYEAARMDGANRLRQAWHMTLPGIRPIIALMFVLQLGQMLDIGFEQVFVMYNPSVYAVADIIDTYVYRTGLGNAEFSLATAAGMFKGIIAFILIYTANWVLKKMGEPTLW